MIEQSNPNELGNTNEKLKRRIRILVLLDTAENAGLVPIRIPNFHTFAYLSNVLSPVWELPVFDGKILKRQGGPFYPVLQQDLDRLVGMGIVTISDISYVLDEEQRWRIEGVYQLNRYFADRILRGIKNHESERKFIVFLQELAYALSALDENDITNASSEDATYSDPLIDTGNVVDFAEWRNINFSANAARYIGQLLPNETQATKGEMLHLFVRHLYRRLHDQQY